MDPKRLFARLAGLRFRLRVVAILQGVFAVTAIMAGGAALAGLLDFRYSLPPLVRALALVAILAAAGLALLRLLLAPLLEQADNLRLALKLEEKNPHLNDILASAVQFLNQPDPDEALSSAVLRKITIRHAVNQAHAVDFGQLLNWRGLLWSMAGLAVALGLAGPPLVLAPAKSATALRRLALPFAGVEWPLQTFLRIEAPEKWPHRLALGEPLEIRAALHGVLPERAVLSVWFDGTPPSDQTWLVSAAESLDRGTLAARVEASRISRNFRVRLRANDADSGWLEVLVLPPPELTPLDGRPSPQIRLEYPRYTDLAPRQLPDGGGNVEAVTGTVVRLRAATNRPVARSWLAYRPEVPSVSVAATFAALSAATPLEYLFPTLAGESVWAPIPVALGRDGRLLEVTFTPRVSGTYALRFEDETGFGATRLLDIRVVPDPAPSVGLYRPSASRDSLNVTPNADLPLSALVADPMFAVRSCWLEYRTEKNDPPRRQAYYDYQTLGQALRELLDGLAWPRFNPSPVPRLRPPEIDIDTRLQISAFRHPDGAPLKEGDVLFLQLAADDFDDVSWDKGPGRSYELELHIVGASALEAQLNRDQTSIRQNLLRLQQWQREARDKVAEAKKNREAAGKLSPDDVDRVIQAEQLQQQIRSRIGDEKEGLRAEVNRVRQAQRDNKLPPAASKERMDDVAAELNRLAREELDPIEPLLSSARENPEVKPEKGEKAGKGEPLAEAARHQQEVERTLSALLQRLEPWSGATELQGETRLAQSEQEKIQQQTEQLDRQLAQKLAAGKRPDSLPPQEQGELKRTADRQEALANQLRDLQEKLDRVAGEKQAQEREQLGKAEKLETAAEERQKQAEQMPADAPEKREALQREAQRLRSEAQEQRDAAANLKREAAAIQEAAKAARNADASASSPVKDSAQPSKLDDAAKKAGNDIRENHLGDAKEKQKQTADTLHRMLDALEERRKDDLDRLAKKMRDTDAKLDDLADRQERLQKKVQEAHQIAEERQREEELQRLAREQARLQQEAKELSQELSRQRAGEAAQSVNRAAREMAEAAQRMERGEQADEPQDDALNKLDDAQRELEQARQQVEDELMRERLARVMDRIKGLRDRQAARIEEAKRIHRQALHDKKWERDLQRSLNDLKADEEALAEELDGLVQQKFQPIKVVARLLEQSSDAMRRAAKQIDARNEEIKSRGADEQFDAASEETMQVGILNWQELALRRLDQLLEALKPDKDSGGGGGGRGAGQPMNGARRGTESEDVPLLAQLKALRAMQVEVSQRTAQFAKDHPDLGKLAEADKAELEFLRKMQRDVADLIQEYGADSEPNGGQP
jgi:hypothetical protein